MHACACARRARDLPPLSPPQAEERCRMRRRAQKCAPARCERHRSCWRWWKRPPPPPPWRRRRRCAAISSQKVLLSGRTYRTYGATHTPYGRRYGSWWMTPCGVCVMCSCVGVGVVCVVFSALSPGRGNSREARPEAGHPGPVDRPPFQGVGPVPPFRGGPVHRRQGWASTRALVRLQRAVVRSPPTALLGEPIGFLVPRVIAVFTVCGGLKLGRQDG